MSWKTIHSDKVFTSPYVVVHKDKVELPGGVQIDDFYTVTVPDAAAIVALTSEKQILLKCEYRYSCQEETVEIPAGTFDKKETNPLDVAKRELLEETGYISNQWTYLCSTREHTAKLTNRMHIFLAENCEKVETQHLDETEQIELITVTFDKAIEMVMNNEISCSTSAYGILRAARMMGV